MRQKVSRSNWVKHEHLGATLLDLSNSRLLQICVCDCLRFSRAKRICTAEYIVYHICRQCEQRCVVCRVDRNSTCAIVPKSSAQTSCHYLSRGTGSNAHHDACTVHTCSEIPASRRIEIRAARILTHSQRGESRSWTAGCCG